MQTAGTRGGEQGSAGGGVGERVDASGRGGKAARPLQRLLRALLLDPLKLAHQLLLVVLVVVVVVVVALLRRLEHFARRMRPLVICHGAARRVELAHGGASRDYGRGDGCSPNLRRRGLE